MINKSVCATAVVAFVFAGALLAGFPEMATAQTTIDSMVRDNINLRRRAEVYKARRKTATGKKVAATGSGTSRRASATKTTASARLATIYFGLDPFQRFRRGEGIFTVTFRFAGSAGKPVFTRSFTYRDGQDASTALFTDIPAGDYQVTAETTSGDGRRVTLATRAGEPSNPNGGDFASAIRVRVGAGKDYYGASIIKSDPETIYVRILN